MVEKRIKHVCSDCLCKGTIKNPFYNKCSENLIFFLFFLLLSLVCTFELFLKVLPLGKTQINLAFRLLIRIFAAEKVWKFR